MDSIPDPASSTGVAVAPDGRYRILCLDGGGIRGALSAALLGLLEQAVPGFLSRVNLFAGTSTGGLIALGLAHGLSPQQCLDLYVKQGGGIFPRTWWRRYGLGWLENFWRSRYSNKRLEAELKAQFGPVRLADLRPVLITSFDLNGEYKRNGQYTGIRSWKPKFFHNFANDPSGADGAESAVEVALRTSAAPTYFPSRSTFVDGGVVANNPSVCALAQACHVGLKADQVVMLSVGTGMNPKFVEAENAMWGWFRWAFFRTFSTWTQSAQQAEKKPAGSSAFPGLMIEGVNDVAAYQAQQLLDERYHRLNPILPSTFELDDADRLQELLDVVKVPDTEAELAQAINWLRRHW